MVFRSHIPHHVGQELGMHTVLQQFNADIQRFGRQSGVQKLRDVVDVLAGLRILQKTWVVLFASRRTAAALILVVSAVVGRTANALLYRILN